MATRQTPSGGAGRPNDSGGADASAVRVLVVEDEPAIATAIAHRMAAEGWRVDIAGDGPSGVRAAAELDPDIVILDVMLPGMDGLEVCRRIMASSSPCRCWSSGTGTLRVLTPQRWRDVVRPRSPRPDPPPC